MGGGGEGWGDAGTVDEDCHLRAAERSRQRGDGFLIGHVADLPPGTITEARCGCGQLCALASDQHNLGTGFVQCVTDRHSKTAAPTRHDGRARREVRHVAPASVARTGSIQSKGRPVCSQALTSPDLAWPSKSSTLAARPQISPRSADESGLMISWLVTVFRYLPTQRPPVYLAAPRVGRTWLVPITLSP